MAPTRRPPAKKATKPSAAAARSSDPFPTSLAPQLATLATKPPTSGSWTYEIKFDGYRMLARLQDGRATLFTRNGNDWTSKLPSLVAELARLPVASAWLDGEAVVLNDKGVPDFNAIQNAFDRSTEQAIVFFVFDAMYLDGRDLRARPQAERTRIVRQLLDGHASERLRLSEAIDANGADALKSACAMGLEGLIAKRLDGLYESKRSSAWLKLKCSLRQKFVVGGFTGRAGAPAEVGSLLLGVYDTGGRLLSAGSVGTGWDSATGRSLLALCIALETKTSPFARPPTKGRWSRRAASSERWIEPRIVVEVSFQEWTPDASIRHGSFKGVRIEKKPLTVVREES